MSGTAEARPPDAIDFDASGSCDCHQVHRPITDLGVDADGHFAAATVEEHSADTNILKRPDLYVFDLRGKSLRWRGSHGKTGDIATTQLVAVAPGNPNTRAGAPAFAVGYADWVSVFPRNGDSPTLRAQQDNARVTDIAMDKSGRYAVASYQTIDQDITSYEGRLVVYDAHASQGAPKARPTKSVARVVAVAPGADVARYAVGTEDALQFFHDWDTDEARPFNITNLDGQVNALEFSDTGDFAVAGTQGGTFYFLAYVGETDDGRPRYEQWSRTLGSPVTDVTISGDGAFMAAGTADGRVKFFRNVGGAGTALGQTLQDWEWRAPGGAAVQDLDANGNGDYIIAGAGNGVYGFYRTNAEPLWVLPLTATAAGVGISHDGMRFAAASEDRFYGFFQTRDVTITPAPRSQDARPKETVAYDIRLKNDGSAVDNFTISFTPPSGWGSPADKGAMLLPGETTDVTVEVRPPEREPPGVYPTLVRVFSQSQNRLVKEVQLNTTVVRTEKINVTSYDRDLRVNASVEEVYAFTVKNEGNGPAFLNFTTYQSPSTGASWEVRVLDYSDDEPIRPIKVARNQEKVVRVAVRAPSFVADGDYNLITLVVDAGNDTAVHRFYARVNPTFGLDLTVDKPSISARPGLTYAVKLRVTNTGNTQDVFHVDWRVQPDSLNHHWNVTAPESLRENVTLGRGSTREIPVNIRPDVRQPRDATVMLLINSTGGVRESIAVQVQLDENAPQGFPTLPAPGAPLLAAALAAAVALTRARWRGETPRR